MGEVARVAAGAGTPAGIAVLPVALKDGHWILAPEMIEAHGRTNVGLNAAAPSQR